MASTKMMIKYLRIFSSILQASTHPIANSFPSCERNGVDQGIHNVILGLKLLSSQSTAPETETAVAPSLHTERSFPVTNLQHSQLMSQIAMMNPSGTHAYFTPKEGHLLQGSGSRDVFALVHQYDRYFQLQLTYARKYVTWIDFSGKSRPLDFPSSLLTCYL
jgi:hypothetical protein